MLSLRQLIHATAAAECDKLNRLDAAEKRANALLKRASLLHEAVAQRDSQNHWQESVDRLFLGGKT